MNSSRSRTASFAMGITVLAGCVVTDYPATLVPIAPLSSVQNSEAASAPLALLPATYSGEGAVTDIPYAAAPAGVDPNLLTFDFYPPANGAALAPLIVYVHGGGWVQGDKANVGEKARYFTENGFAFASVNYRLSSRCTEDACTDGIIRHPVHAWDVAAATATLIEQAPLFGIQADNIHLMGHSAGAHLATLVATDPDYLTYYGIEPQVVRCAVSLDTAALDIPATMESAGPRLKRTYFAPFGEDQVLWAAASPITHLDRRAGDMRYLLVTQTQPRRVRAQQGFDEAARAAGFEVVVTPIQGLDHAGISRALGTDHPLTEQVSGFLMACADG